MTVIVVGGGAAGFFAAIHHQTAHPGDTVIIIEKSANLLSKVKISGGGRCNVTHACFTPNEWKKTPKTPKNRHGTPHLV